MANAGAGTKYRYRVAPGTSIIMRDRSILKPGDYLPDNYPPKKIESLKRSRHVIVENFTSHPDPVEQGPVAEPPGVDPSPIPLTAKDSFVDDGKKSNPAPFGTGVKLSDRGRDAEVIVEKANRVRPLARTSGPIKQVESIWTIDPASIQGKSLDQLNVMIAERDPTQLPCTSVEEAIALLSNDFDPATASQVAVA